MGAVQGNADKPFLPAIRMVADKIEEILGVFNAGPHRSPAPSAEFQHRHNGRGLGFSQAGLKGKFLYRGNLLFPVKPFQQFFCQDVDIFSLDSGIKEDRQQFIIR
jgi:hypothetical protein